MAETSGERLRRARERAGFRSATQAAKRFGWKVTTYMSHENGQTDVPPKRAPVYARAFKIPGGAPYLLYGDSKPRDPAPPKSRLQELADKLPAEKERQAVEFLEFLIRQRR